MREPAEEVYPTDTWLGDTNEAVAVRTAWVPGPRGRALRLTWCGGKRGCLGDATVWAGRVLIS